MDTSKALIDSVRPELVEGFFDKISERFPLRQNQGSTRTENK